jgi:hypothetical protein
VYGKNLGTANGERAQINTVAQHSLSDAGAVGYSPTGPLPGSDTHEPEKVYGGE